MPSGLGGVANWMFLHPATRAGTPNIIAVEGRTAVPPGTYNPTRSMGLANLEQMIPGIVSTCFGESS